MLYDKLRVLVIGKNSFIAKHFIKVCLKNKINHISCSHFNIPKKFNNFDWVINFTINPRFFFDQYSQIIDQDALIAKNVSKYKNVKYVMLSSRLVYGYDTSLEPASENQRLRQKSNITYGLNKILSEQNCRSIISPSNLLIARGSNVFGYEINRNSFTGIALGTLLTKSEILLDISKDTIRDFIPVNFFARYLFKLITNNCFGIYNIGSGLGLKLEEFCNALIEGFDHGTLKSFDNLSVKDQFILDNKKLINVTNEKIYKSDIIKYTKNIGKKLKKEAEVKKING